ncbi:aspartyl-tRNA(Asn)/glutamyl-tRNA(Gln) amidotransferase subunit A [Enhydrobacter aerosaccus]|uniref:Aspartyl-tRNA(Asn)/glutamyl-tRNA(Gln) amidotransferase subunit A n=1 Tax=Enhydrobacter aerosaccus TaxID=225324 RepID=A0A1T4KTC3_9HYPH|nr:amidase family protein [Enhydrobacter aerosaccus]SJZ45682.1 aspartyl-tRNA(Asn)/glutamyl-tRNA(Gln) amidotransferase subunit A [Enhydrobacter aerosaccus]
MTAELWQLPAATLREQIAARKLSPVELTKAVLDRADRLQPILNCFITLVPDQAMAAAREAEQAVMQGKALGPLHGIPYSVKDLVNTAGVRTTFGSRLYETNVPRDDAVAAARLKAAGAILFGKTTTPEFGHKALTDAPLFGRTRNAWNAERSSGGSSGGAAVAVAAGIGPIGIATDGGGSTRIPASANGMVGFKQSLGVVPHSQAPDAFGNYTYVTPMTRTVMDTALMLQAMAGPHPVDPWSIGIPAQDYISAARPDGDLRGKRILHALRFGNTYVAKDVQVAFEAALTRLRDLGAELIELDQPVPDMEAVWKIINHTTWRARFHDMILRDGERMSPSLVRQVAMAQDWTGADYQKAMFQRAEIFRLIQRWFEKADYLVTPTLARTALPIDQDLFEPITIDGIDVGELRRNFFPYCMAFNITGHPALSLCCGYDSEGLPIGLQIVGHFRDDASVLRAAALYEASEDWLARWPSL